MATKDEILLRLLKDENYVSGEELARQTGVSRAAVWKAIKSLKKSGYDVRDDIFDADECAKEILKLL